MKSKEKKKVVAIICEFNPMHTGHKHIISEAKKITNADFCLGLMSGNFSQRSAPCVLNKYDRAEIATKNGMDIVVNLPTAFCTNNAEIFALSSIKILNKLNVDFLVFGSEITNLDAFYALAKFELNEPKIFKKTLKKHLKNGLNYNASYVYALKESENLFEKTLFDDIILILQKPNSVLALEYIKALIKTKSKIKPFLIPRVDNYNSNNEIDNFVSSSFIREKLNETNAKNINFLPKNSISFFDKYHVNFDLFYALGLYSIKTSSIENLSKIYGTCEGLEYKLSSEAKSAKNYQNFLSNVETKRYKTNRIKSIILNTQLGITKKIVRKIYTIKTNIFVKVLALNAEKSEILSNLNTKCLIIRKKDFDNAHLNSYNKKIILIENKANSLYNTIAVDCDKTHIKVDMLEEDFYNKIRVVNNKKNSNNIDKNNDMIL